MIGSLIGVSPVHSGNKIRPVVVGAGASHSKGPTALHDPIALMVHRPQGLPAPQGRLTLTLEDQLCRTSKSASPRSARIS